MTCKRATTWPVGLPGCPSATALALGATFANVEEALWAQAETAMAGLESEADWRVWLAQGRERFAGRAASFWAAEDRAPGWGLLARAADLLAAVATARGELDGLTAPAALLARYAEAWWRIDSDFRVLREVLDAHEGPCYERLRDRCNRSYRDILARMNDRFTALLRSESAWPADALARQDGFWADIFGEPGAARGKSAKGAARRGKIAIMFVDALRYELGQALHAALDDRRRGRRAAHHGQAGGHPDHHPHRHDRAAARRRAPRRAPTMPTGASPSPRPKAGRSAAT